MECDVRYSDLLQVQDIAIVCQSSGFLQNIGRCGMHTRHVTAMCVQLIAIMQPCVCCVDTVC